MAEECQDPAECGENHCDVCGMCGAVIEIDECGDCLGVHCDSCDGDCIQEDD